MTRKKTDAIKPQYMTKIGQIGNHIGKTLSRKNIKEKSLSVVVSTT